MKRFGSIEELDQLKFRQSTRVLTIDPAAQTSGDSTLTLPDFGGTNHTFVFAGLAQTLTNKTIDGDSNTLQDIAITSLKTVLADANTFISRDGSGNVISTKAVPTGTVVGSSDSQTLTNKTIDADLNTISNIENADIKSGANISLNKLAATTASRALVSDVSGVISASSVTSTELGYVAGVTSGIQSQIDLKAPLASPTFTGTVTTPAFNLSGQTASTVPYLDASKNLISSVVTPTELGYLSGVTSAIQTQFSGKASTTLNNLGTTSINASLFFASDNLYQIGTTSVAPSNILSRILSVTNGTNSSTIRPSLSLATNTIFRLPPTNGTNGYVLSMTDNTTGETDWIAAGTGDVTSNTATSVDSEVALFNGTSGKQIKRATGTGIATLTSGVLSTTATTGSGNVVLATSPSISGNFTVDTDTFFVDGTNNRVGIGTTSPAVSLEVRGLGRLDTDNSATELYIGRHTSNTAGSLISGYKSQGASISSPTAITAGSDLLAIQGNGHNGTAYAGGARIELGTDSAGTISSTSMPGRLSLYTTTDGTNVLTERIRIGNDGITTFYFKTAIKGTATNDAAASGNVGETTLSSVARASATSLTTATAKTITSISLAAGDWDIRGAVAFTHASTTSRTSANAAISLTNNALPASSRIANPTGNEIWITHDTPAQVPGSGADMTVGIPTYRVSLSSTTTIYLVAQATFTVSTLNGYGYIEARRIR